VSKAITASFPPLLDLPDGYIVTWAAIDQATGADVAGVVVSGVSIFGTLLDAGAVVTDQSGPFMLVPGPGA
jgi:hypothetical protein